MNNELFELCRFIGRMLGEPDEQEASRQQCACHLRTESIFFQTEDMLIGVGTNDLSMVVERRKNNNPVLVVNSDGKVIRAHGEIRYLQPEIHDIAQCLAKHGIVQFSKRKR